MFQEDKGNAVYTGDFVQGKKHGHGSMQYPNGDKYAGSWLRNAKHGDGTYTYSNGDLFSGKWSRNQRTGKGAFVVASSGSQLVGSWVKGKLQHGRWVLADGTVYSGAFSNNQPKGKGLFTFPHGSQQEGEYGLAEGEEGGEEEEGVTKPQSWQGSTISRATASSAVVNRTIVPPAPFVPSVETLSLVNIESISTADGNEVVMIVNSRENDVNLKGCRIGVEGSSEQPFIIVDDFELGSGKRVRVLSGASAKSPPPEEEDVLNLIWDSSSHWGGDGVAKLWIEDEAKTRGIISSFAFSAVKAPTEEGTEDA